MNPNNPNETPNPGNQPEVPGSSQPSGPTQSETAQQQYQYKGPVAETNFQPAEYDISYNSATQVVPVRPNRRRMQLVILGVVMLLVGAVIAFVVMTRDDTPKTPDSSSADSRVALTGQESAEGMATESSDALDSENEQTEEPTEEAEAPAVSSDPAVEDHERKADLNDLFQNLELFFNDHGYYPSDLKTGEVADLSPETLTDPAGNLIKIDIPRLSTQLPVSPYTASMPTGAQYTYSPYNCGPGASGDAKCNKYVMYAWLAGDSAGYSKQSLN